MLRSLVLSAVAATAAGAQTPPPSIRDLGWLIGEWTFEDAQIEGDYREHGTRRCDWVLGGDYIRCESRGVDHRGRARSYLWFLNYNQRERRVEITSLFEGNPRKYLYTGTLHDGGRRLEIRFGVWEGDGVAVEGGATVRYDGANRYVWENARFRDVVTRR